jgi:hypothetical protein
MENIQQPGRSHGGLRSGRAQTRKPPKIPRFFTGGSCYLSPPRWFHRHRMVIRRRFKDLHSILKNEIQYRPSLTERTPNPSGALQSRCVSAGNLCTYLLFFHPASCCPSLISQVISVDLKGANYSQFPPLQVMEQDPRLWWKDQFFLRP